MVKWLFILVLLIMPLHGVVAQTPDVLDTDNDGLSDTVEIEIYKTAFDNPDTDGDGYTDGDEITFLYDPNNQIGDKLEKKIFVDLKTQTLKYALGNYTLAEFKISSGKAGYRTPPGEFTIYEKKPVHVYKGRGYYYPRVRWNMKFKDGTWGDYYIHGAYWHNNFGTPVSHGCINVAYKDIEALYNWADVGTKVIVQ